jgi:hypothetical protein
MRLAVALAALLTLAAPPATTGVQLPVRSAIFYYPWYGTPARDGAWRHWQDRGHAPPRDLAAAFYPAHGPYSSSDPAVVAAQMREIASAGIGEVVTSWWGRGSPEDARLPSVLHAARAQGLRVAVHVEPYPGRSASSVAADVASLRKLGVADFYVYRPRDIAATDWRQVRLELPGIRLFAQTNLVGFAAAAGFDGVYTYDIVTYDGSKLARLCAQARARHLLCAPSVGPGYDAARATGDTHVKPRRAGRTYDAMWTSALRARPDLVTITSYNEWGEGTQIEPARARPGYESYGGAYGLRGRSAERAYLTRTAYWTSRLATR